MKKIFLLICLTMFLSTSIAQATMSEYKNPSFNFSKVKNILILDTEDDSTKRNSVTNDFAFRQVDQMLLEALERRGVRVTYASKALVSFNSTNAKPYDVLIAEQGQEQADAIFFAWASNSYDAYLTPVLLEHEHSTHRVASYVTTYTIYDNIQIYDNKGNYTTIRTPRTVYETVPESYYQSSDICINFAVYSTVDHTEIYLLQDERSRDESNAFDGMMKRICENLAKKIYENMPNARTK